MKKIFFKLVSLCFLACGWFLIINISSVKSVSGPPDDLNSCRVVSETAPDSPPSAVFIDVPFTVQAPFGEWSDPRQQDGCEEASLVMAWYWIKGEPISKQKAKDEILAISKFEREFMGGHADISAEDTKKVFENYYKIGKIKVIYDIGIQEIKNELLAGSIVLTPVNGIKLKNPYFRRPGPDTHMILIKGFDDQKQEFITHDPGTRRGENFRYGYETIMKSIINYSTGHHAPPIDGRKVVIVIGK